MDSFNICVIVVDMTLASPLGTAWEEGELQTEHGCADIILSPEI